MTHRIPDPRAPSHAPDHDANRVVIFDTTLRDGEQSPGATMTHEEKLEVAELLDEMGVDIIEAGFPIASDGDFAAVHEIAKRTKNAVVCGLARARSRTSTAAPRRSSRRARRRIHTFLSTSPVHMKYKLQKEPHEVYEMVIAQVTRARNYTDDVEWSSEDGTRTEHDFLCRCVEAAIKAGATTINIPDTVGYTVPEEYFALFKMRARAGAEFRPGASSPCIATTISAWRWPTRSPACAPAPARSNAPSTASASAPATPRWKKS